MQPAAHDGSISDSTVFGYHYYLDTIDSITPRLSECLPELKGPLILVCPLVLKSPLVLDSLLGVKIELVIKG